ncbi:MAG: hypothetical protein KatS3mg081_2635 [Gemmatimonadales bacterium]|nr:MAG: hypothetical protein KatS3mg081_2635 [Gemmatimonadales bacterium]
MQAVCFASLSPRVRALAVAGAAALVSAVCFVPQEPRSFEIQIVVPTDTVKLALAGEISLAVAVKLRDGEAVPARLRFESSDSSVVAVDSTGKIRGLSRGVALVRVKVLGAAAGRELPSAGVNVRVIVAAMRLARTAETMTAVGDTILVSPGYLDARGNPIAPSDSARIVLGLSLVSSGRAVALGSGSRVIAKANGVDTVKVVVDTSSAFLVVSVQQLVDSVAVEPDSFTFTALTDTARFRAVVLDRRRNPVADPPVTWRSSDAARVAIAPDGLATARDTGSVELALEAGGKVARARVRVIQLVDMVDLRPGPGLPDDSVLVIRRLGARRQLAARVLDRRAQLVKGGWVRWESHNDSVAVVDSTGVVTALRDGRASVVARGWSPADSASRRDSLIVVVDRYTLEVAVTGRGLVSAQSGVLTCDARSSGQCSASVRLDSGWVDTLWAQPMTDWVFGGWTRSCSGTQASCPVSLTSSVPVSAAFVPVPPAAPTNLMATAVSSSRIDLSWTDSANNEDGFRIERCVGSGCSSFTQIDTVGANVTAYQNTGLMAATSYSYRVRAYNAGGNSGYSNTATATTLPNAPAAPSNLVATAVSATQIDLSWTDNANNEDGFKIERCVGSGCSSFRQIATVEANITTYHDTGLSPYTAYTYRVLAYNSGGNSEYSNLDTATTYSEPPLPPSEVTVTEVTSFQVTISWKDNSADEDSFQIERCQGLSCTDFVRVNAVGSNVVTYTDTNLVPETTYSYRLRAQRNVPPGLSDYSATVTATTLQSPVRPRTVAAGLQHSCAIAVGGKAYCWGLNDQGQLGDGSTTSRAVPTPVASDLTFRALTAGWGFTCGLTIEARAFCWGSNGSGQLGNGTTQGSVLPVAVLAGVRFKSISAGSAHACAVALDGTAYCWGANSSGQLGHGTMDAALVPTKVQSSVLFAHISAGVNHTCAVSENGMGYCWGSNSQGKLGDGTIESKPTPTAVAGGLQFVSIRAGASHTCGVSTSGLGYCWGSNSNGELGDGTGQAKLTPTPVSGGLLWQRIEAGDDFSCGFAVGRGEPYCWGDNGDGQAGDGTSVTRLAPVPVQGDIALRDLSSGTFHSCGVTAAGDGYCWGHNGSGELGDGTVRTSQQRVPQKIAGNLAVTSITAGLDYSCAVSGGGGGYCWGLNYRGQLGDGTYFNRSTPASVASGLPWREIVASMDPSPHTCGTTTDGAVYCWGSNSRGQLGDNTTTERTSPVGIAGPSGVSFKQVVVGDEHSCALSSGGQAYCWGANYSGQLGDSTTVQRNAPVPVKGGLLFSSLAAGYAHTCGLTASGRAYCWGNNGRGQLGDGTTTRRIVPTAVNQGTLVFVKIASGYTHTCAISSAAALYCWGSNFYGELGNNSTTDSREPVQVSGLASVVAAEAGSGYTCALKSDGSAYCWGNNSAGQLGDGTTVTRLTPVPVASSLRFSAIAGGWEHTCAVATDGSGYCWGRARDGALGGGGVSWSPVRVTGGLTFQLPVAQAAQGAR